MSDIREDDYSEDADKERIRRSRDSLLPFVKPLDEYGDFEYLTPHKSGPTLILAPSFEPRTALWKDSRIRVEIPTLLLDVRFQHRERGRKHFQGWTQGNLFVSQAVKEYPFERSQGFDSSKLKDWQGFHSSLEWLWAHRKKLWEFYDVPSRLAERKLNSVLNTLQIELFFGLELKERCRYCGLWGQYQVCVTCLDKNST
jgi:hypothetical protein